jgi:ACS family tartrate transporter-like MFS transporter
LVLGVATIFYLTDWPKDARWLCEGERAWITGELEFEKQAKKTEKPLNVWQALRNRDVVRLTLAAFFALTTLYGFGFWLPKIVQRLSSQSVLQVTLLSGIPVLAALPSTLLNGWHSDRSSERRWHAALSLLAAAVWLAS